MLSSCGDHDQDACISPRCCMANHVGKIKENLGHIIKEEIFRRVNNENPRTELAMNVMNMETLEKSVLHSTMKLTHLQEEHHHHSTLIYALWLERQRYLLL
jgi:regulator of replication initiation timing